YLTLLTQSCSFSRLPHSQPFVFFFPHPSLPPLYLPSFPSRRSSDLFSPLLPLSSASLLHLPRLRLTGPSRWPCRTCIATPARSSSAKAWKPYPASPRQSSPSRTRPRSSRMTTAGRTSTRLPKPLPRRATRPRRRAKPASGILVHGDV